MSDRERLNEAQPSRLAAANPPAKETKQDSLRLRAALSTANVLALQRAVGNAAVGSIIVRQPPTANIQRCGPMPCECGPEERAARAEVAGQAGEPVQRQEAGSATGNVEGGATNATQSVEVAATASAAGQQILNDLEKSTLPRLKSADELLKVAKGYLEYGIAPGPGGFTPGLPQQTLGIAPKECVPRGTLQATRVAMDQSNTDLLTAIRVFKAAQASTKLAVRDATITCLASLVSLFVPLLGLPTLLGKPKFSSLFPTPPVAPSGAGGLIKGLMMSLPRGVGALGGVAATFAACVACIKAATPVEAAVIAEGKAHDDLLPAMDKLGKAIANFEAASRGRHDCKDFGAVPGELAVPP